MLSLCNDTLKFAVQFFSNMMKIRRSFRISSIFVVYSKFNNLAKENHAANFRELLRRGDFSLQIRDRFSHEKIFRCFERLNL